MAKYLKMQKQSECSLDCYYSPRDVKCPQVGNDMACIAFGCIFIEDTIIPQKLALYDEMFKALRKQLENGMEGFQMDREEAVDIKHIIDRAKKITEE